MMLNVEMREKSKTRDQGLCACRIVVSLHCILFPQATQEELDVEKRLCQVCSQHGVKIHMFWTSTLYHRDDLPFRPIARWAAPWYHLLLLCPICFSLQ